MNKNVLRQVSIVIATIFTIVVNGIVEAIRLNGVTSAEVSNSVPTFFTPPGYVFGIWSIIYIGLIAYAVYQGMPAQRDNLRLKAAAPYYLVSALANGLWLVLFHFYMWVGTIVVMLILLGSLIMVYIQLREGSSGISNGERWFVRLPFSIYLGWVSVATIANVVIVLTTFKINLPPFEPIAWTIVLLAVGALLGLTISVLAGDAAFPLVFVWAFVGISTVNNGAINNVAVAASIILAIISIVAMLPINILGLRQSRGS